MLGLCRACLSLSPGAQDSPPRPAWLVPVVEQVGGDQVRPTTGVALGAGRVLVPLDFVTGGGPLFVLDGGPDLEQDGRAAVLEVRLPNETW